jgi:hypothetical protein
VIEEGPLAGWIWRNLQDLVDDMVASEPRRNRLIARDGDKDDKLDAEKLAKLLRGGFVKAVHQCKSLEQAVFKQQVAVYHQRVGQRVREGFDSSQKVLICRSDFLSLHDQCHCLVRRNRCR